MKQTMQALRLSIFIGENDTWHHRPLYHEIVQRVHKAGLAGATVLRGSEGFGTSSTVHTTRLLDLAENLPIVILIVDEESKVRSFLPEIDDLVAEGTVLVDEVQAIHYTKDE